MNIISEQNDISKINFVAGMSDPGEMIRCGYRPELRRRSGETDKDYAARIYPLVMALPQNERDMILNAAIRRASLDTSNGKIAMFSGSGIVPWHGLGTVVSGLATAKEALELASLNWTVKPMPVTVNGRVLDLKDQQGIVRSDTGDCLGIVKGRYTPIQNADAFDFFDRIVGEGKAVYDTAGSLRGGKQVWLLAKVNGPTHINGDEHRQWCLMVTSHDGSYAQQLSWVCERVVCANTLSIAMRGQSNKVTIRHTKNWQDKEKEARRVLGFGERYFDTIQEALSTLGSKLLTAEQMTQFSQVLVPAKDENDIPTQTKNIRAEIDRLFARGDGNKGSTRWDALNAVTDYVDHSRTLRGDNSTRLESSLLGSGSLLKQRAFDLLSSDSLMDQLMQGDFKPESRTIDSDFARLLNN